MKKILGYVLICLAGWLLFSAVWGATCGALFAAKLARDPDFMRQMKEEIGDTSATDSGDVLSNLSDEKKAVLYRIVKERLKKTNWLPVHLTANFLTFMMLGFAAGIFLKEYRYSGIIPIALLPITLRVLTVPTFANPGRYLNIPLSLVAQFCAVYGFAYLGFRIRAKGRDDLA